MQLGLRHRLESADAALLRYQWVMSVRPRPDATIPPLDEHSAVPPPWANDRPCLLHARHDRRPLAAGVASRSPDVGVNARVPARLDRRGADRRSRRRRARRDARPSAGDGGTRGAHLLGRRGAPARRSTRSSAPSIRWPSTSTPWQPRVGRRSPPLVAADPDALDAAIGRGGALVGKIGVETSRLKAQFAALPGIGPGSEGRLGERPARSGVATVGRALDSTAGIADPGRPCSSGVGRGEPAHEAADATRQTTGSGPTGQPGQLQGGRRGARPGRPDPGRRPRVARPAREHDRRLDAHAVARPQRGHRRGAPPALHGRWPTPAARSRRKRAGRSPT